MAPINEGMAKKIKIIVEYEAYEPDPEVYPEEMTGIRDMADHDIENYEADPAALLDLTIEKVRYRLVED